MVIFISCEIQGLDAKILETVSLWNTKLAAQQKPKIGSPYLVGLTSEEAPIVSMS